MVDEEKMLAELIEINLLFARLELDIVNVDPSALGRVRHHIEEAMKDICAHKRRSSEQSNQCKIVSSKQRADLLQPA